MPDPLELTSGIAGQNNHRIHTLEIFAPTTFLGIGLFSEPHPDTENNAHGKVRAALEHNPLSENMMIFANDIMTFVIDPPKEGEIIELAGWRALRKSETPEGVAANLAALSPNYLSIGHSALHVPDNPGSLAHEELHPMQCEFRIKREKIAYLQTVDGVQDYIETYEKIFPNKPNSYLKVSGFCSLTLFAMGFLTHIDGQDVSQITPDELYELIFDVAYMLLGTFSPYALQKLVMHMQPETTSAAALAQVFAKINPYPSTDEPDAPFIIQLRDLAHSVVALYTRNTAAQHNIAPAPSLR